MANQTGTAPSLTVPFWRPGVIVASGLAAYSNSFGGVFLLDDDLHLANFIVRDPFLGWAHYFTLQTPRPVAMATLAANYAVGGLDPWGYHLVNLVVHLAAALVLYALIGRTLRLPEMPDRYRSRAADLAFAAAAVWVVHPLTTQAVTYVIQRMESLMALWYLIALYALNRGATADRAGGRFGWYAAATISAWLSLGTKEVGMTLPVAALMYDRCYLSGSWGTAVRKRGLVYVTMATGWVLLTPNLAGIVQTFSVGPPEGDFGPPMTWKDYARTEPGVILHYLRLAVWPRPLCFDPRWPIARTPEEFVPQSVVFGGVLAATLWAVWRYPRVGYLPAVGLLILSPTSSFVAIRDPMYEYRMYLPLAAFVTFGILGFDATLSGWRANRWVRPALLAAGVAGYGVMTYQRNQLYRDPVALWADVVAQRPGSPRARYWLAKSLVEAGRPADAIDPIRFVIGFDSTADPENAVDGRHLAEAHDVYGQALAGIGDDEAAVREFRAACGMNPVRGSYSTHLRAALRRVGRLSEDVPIPGSGPP